jgi:hypothetical protein
MSIWNEMEWNARTVWNEMESRNGMRERYGMKWNRGMECANGSVAEWNARTEVSRNGMRGMEYQF